MDKRVQNSVTSRIEVKKLNELFRNAVENETNLEKCTVFWI